MILDFYTARVLFMLLGISVFSGFGVVVDAPVIYASDDNLTTTVVVQTSDNITYVFPAEITANNTNITITIENVTLDTNASQEEIVNVTENITPIYVGGGGSGGSAPKFTPEEEVFIRQELSEEVILYPGLVGDWDESFNVEIGNMLKVGSKKYLYYTGYKGKLDRSLLKPGEVYCGVAVNNGAGWVKQGKTMHNYRCEDPYVIYEDGLFWMIFEDKEYLPDQNSSLAVSVDGENFKVVRRGILGPTNYSIINLDASSPILLKEGKEYVVLYEQRGVDADFPNQGSTGYAKTRYLGEDFILENETIIWGSAHHTRNREHWRAFVATDDVVYLNGTYYLTQHALTHADEGKWTTGIWTSDRLDGNWTLVVDEPAFQTNTVMMELVDDCIRFFTYHDYAIRYLNSSHLHEHGVPGCSFKL